MPSDPSLKRYTELPYVLQCLQTRTLTLLSPSTWDDKNDAFFIDEFRKQRRLRAVHALCLTEAVQTYHHWKVFTHGASGACLYFDRSEFEKWLTATSGLAGRKVLYRTVRELRARPPSLADLPFLKRRAYSQEDEFRLLHCSQSSAARTWSIAFPIEMVEQVVLNPWLPVGVVTDLKAVIRSLPGCSNLPVQRATIVQSDEWQRLAVRAK